jgi:hypothetical protein
VTLTVKGTTISAKVGRDGIYLHRGSGSLDVGLRELRTIALAFDNEDFMALTAASTRQSTIYFARRCASGDVALAGFGDGHGGDGPPIATAFFEDLIPPGSKFVRGVLIHDHADTRLRVTDGLIELPGNTSDESRSQARRIVSLVENKEGIGERIEKLASIEPADLEFFEEHAERRAVNYLEFRAVPTEKLGTIVLVDLQFTSADPFFFCAKVTASRRSQFLMSNK